MTVSSAQLIDLMLQGHAGWDGDGGGVRQSCMLRINSLEREPIMKAGVGPLGQEFHALYTEHRWIVKDSVFCRCAGWHLSPDALCLITERLVKWLSCQTVYNECSWAFIYSSHQQYETSTNHEGNAQIIVTPWRRIGEWEYSSTLS
jgi:hypothetical protein